MPNGWSSKETYLKGVSVGASETNTPVSQEFPLTAGGACTGLVVKISTSSTTVSTGITAKLQTTIDGDWQDSKTVSISGDGAFYIKILRDSTYMPLLNRGRVVVTSGSGDAVTIDSVAILQEL